MLFYLLKMNLFTIHLQNQSPVLVTCFCDLPHSVQEAALDCRQGSQAHALFSHPAYWIVCSAERSIKLDGFSKKNVLLDFLKNILLMLLPVMGIDAYSI